MHELAICQGLMRQVADVARVHGAQRVLSVTVRVGPLVGVEPALLEDAFPFASVGTVAADAGLVVERSEVRIQCPSCARQSEVPSTRLVCPHCSEWRVQLLSGTELFLTRVEFERTEDE